MRRDLSGTLAVRVSCRVPGRAAAGLLGCCERLERVASYSFRDARMPWRSSGSSSGNTGPSSGSRMIFTRPNLRAATCELEFILQRASFRCKR